MPYGLEKAIWFRTLCSRHGVQVSDAQMKLIEEFVRRLLEWNRKVNLISRKDEENVWERHIAGAIAFLYSARLAEGSSILDLGTGGGLPGIPLAILLPSARLTLIDSIRKKIAAVSDIIASMKIQNATAICGRAEDLNERKDLRGAFDYVVARAVGPSHQIVTWARPFLRPAETRGEERHQTAGGKIELERGSILLLKGGDLDQEIEEVNVKVNPRSIRLVPLQPDKTGVPAWVDKTLLLIQP